MPVGQCSLWVLRKTVTVGILVFHKKNKLSTLYKLQKAMHTISETKQQIAGSVRAQMKLVSQTKNYSRQFDLECPGSGE